MRGCPYSEKVHSRVKRYHVDNFQTYIQSILIIHRFHTCKFAYLLKFIFKLKIDSYGDFVATYSCVQGRGGLGSPSAHVPEQGDVLPPCHTCFRL